MVRGMVTRKYGVRWQTPSVPSCSWLHLDLALASSAMLGL
jgi:hypothetical protein